MGEAFWVDKGVSQGSVLGPAVSIIVINGLLEIVDSLVKIVADDTKVYHAMWTTTDNVALGKDLNSLDEVQTLGVGQLTIEGESRSTKFEVCD